MIESIWFRNSAWTFWLALIVKPCCFQTFSCAVFSASCMSRSVYAWVLSRSNMPAHWSEVMKS